MHQSRREGALTTVLLAALAAAPAAVRGAKDTCLAGERVRRCEATAATG